MKSNASQVCVVGAGAAGLYAALSAARLGAHVTLVSATPLAGSSSYWAQGGLAAAMSALDSPDLHLRDTVAAGRGTVRSSAAKILCDEAPAAVEDLGSLGVRFDADRRGRLALGLEGGHSVRRIVHAGGAATGRRLIRQLSALVAQDERVDVFEGRRVTALLSACDRATGVRLADGTTIASAAVIVATGGAAALWARTTNPAGATGGGLLLAHRAGAALADLEMMQFHPTAVVAANGTDGFLVTEAVRGEGALLLDAGGDRFVDELAPRDEVARAVQRRMVETGSDSVALDMRDVDPALFPNVVTALRSAGIDPERELVPVAPAAHYMMGGIATDLDGRATLSGLYAVGECSCTGLHGANRLASNSLTECFVFGARAARAAASEPSPEGGVLEPSGGHSIAAADDPSIAAADDQSIAAAGDPSIAAADDQSIAAAGDQSIAAAGDPPPVPTIESREALWREAGLERTRDGLEALMDDPHPLVRLVATCALLRTESRGAHRRLDYPATDPALDERHATVRADAEPVLERWD